MVVFAFQSHFLQKYPVFIIVTVLMATYAAFKHSTFGNCCYFNSSHMEFLWIWLSFVLISRNSSANVRARHQIYRKCDYNRVQSWSQASVHTHLHKQYFKFAHHILYFDKVLSFTAYIHENTTRHYNILSITQCSPRTSCKIQFEYTVATI